MQVGFRLVDVFTETPFAGNQLCVVTDLPADLEFIRISSALRDRGDLGLPALGEEGYCTT